MSGGSRGIGGGVSGGSSFGCSSPDDEEEDGGIETNRKIDEDEILNHMGDERD